jgi:hypothetical protein
VAQKRPVRKLAVKLCSGHLVPFRVAGRSNARKTVTVLKDLVATTVVKGICAVVTQEGKQCDLSKSPAALGFNNNVWPTVFRNIIGEIGNTYPKLKATKGEVMDWFSKPLEALGKELVKRIS